MVAGVSEKRSGLGYWMQKVLDECDKAYPGLAADPVHDLRTALRRCRSMAEGIRVFDRDPAWKKMRRQGKQLFSSLGDLRDTHVMMEWAERLGSKDDPASQALATHLANEEQKLSRTTANVLQAFDRKQWNSWAGRLPDRAARIPVDGALFAHLALERWNEARILHHRALRNRTNVAFHELRIGLKKFRYIVENFLPSLHEKWGDDLKRVQDILGDVHDLDVLWHTALEIRAFSDSATRLQWRTRIARERRERLDCYRKMMTGESSLWAVWRAALPKPEELRPLGLERLRTWASFFDRTSAHASHVSRLALQLYDGLPVKEILRGSRLEKCRPILQLAAVCHEVGRSKGNQGHHKMTARLLRKIEAPLGWSRSELITAALIARYHRGALPRDTQKRFAVLSPARKKLVLFLAGILRLACACDWEHKRKIRGVVIDSSASLLRIRALGYVESTPLAEHLAAARHLLEVSCGRPILIAAADERVGARAA